MLFIVALYNTLLQKLKVVYFLQRNVVIIAFDFYLKFNGEYSHRNILQLQINGYCHQKYKVLFTDFFFNFSVNLKESGRGCITIGQLRLIVQIYFSKEEVL